MSDRRAFVPTQLQVAAAGLFVGVVMIFSVVFGTTPPQFGLVGLACLVDAVDRIRSTRKDPALIGGST